MEIKVPTNEMIDSPKKISRIINEILAMESEVDRKKEHCWVIGFSTRMKIEFIDLVSLGSLNMAVAHPREIFRLSIMKAVCSLIVVHNHPSGDCQPSEEDIAMTRRLILAGQILGIELEDHIIVGDTTYSFRASNENLFEEVK